MNAIAMPPVDAGVIARRDEIIAALRAAIGDEHVIVSEDERRAYETDALTAYRAVPLAVVLPGSTEEVAAVLKVLSAAKVKVVTACPDSVEGAASMRTYPRSSGRADWWTRNSSSQSSTPASPASESRARRW